MPMPVPNSYTKFAASQFVQQSPLDRTLTGTDQGEQILGLFTCERIHRSTLHGFKNKGYPGTTYMLNNVQASTYDARQPTHPRALLAATLPFCRGNQVIPTFVQAQGKMSLVYPLTCRAHTPWVRRACAITPKGLLQGPDSTACDPACMACRRIDSPRNKLHAQQTLRTLLTSTSQHLLDVLGLPFAHIGSTLAAHWLDNMPCRAV